MKSLLLAFLLSSLSFLAAQAETLPFKPDESMLKQFITSGAPKQDFDSEYWDEGYKWRVLRSLANEFKTKVGSPGDKVNFYDQNVTDLSYIPILEEDSIEFKANLTISSNAGPLCIDQIIELKGKIRQNPDGSQVPILIEFTLKPNYEAAPAAHANGWYQCA